MQIPSILWRYLAQFLTLLFNQAQQFPPDRNCWRSKRSTTPTKFLCLTLMAGLLSIAIAAVNPAPIYAQLPFLGNQLSVNNNRPVVNSSGQIGSIVYAPIMLDGHNLFSVGAESAGTNVPGIARPVDTKIGVIEERLKLVVDRGVDVNNLEIIYEITPDNNAEVFLVNGLGLAEPFKLLTLTQIDATVCGLTLAESGDHIVHILHDALINAWQERQPAYLQRHAIYSVLAILGMIASSGILWFIQKRLNRQWGKTRSQHRQRAQELADNHQDNLAEEEDITDDHQNVMEQIIGHEVLCTRQVNRYNFRRTILQIAHVTIWFGGIAWIVGLFPYSRWLQFFILSQPLMVVVLLIVRPATSYSSIFIDRSLDKWAKRESISENMMQRWNLRINSFGPVVKGGATTLLWLFTVLFVLYSLRIPIAPILAGAGILGLAVSLGAQTLVRDLISGALILIEDQYAIGDFVILNETFGRVEKMNLRTTSLRNRQGNLITLPNSDIRLVNNLSKDWARYKLHIYVDHATEVDYAYKIIQQVADEMIADQFWGDQIIEAEIRGVEEIDALGYSVGLRFETKPGIYRKVVREYRRRIKSAFEKAGIKFGMNLMSILNRDVLKPIGIGSGNGAGSIH
jgi:small-conductance mechanosensitive channel